MKIKIFLDTICGWCYIGHKKLFKALAEFKDRKFEVEYAPFLLNPDMPLAGIKRSDYLVMKFGGKENAQPMYDRMTEQAKSENLNFRLNDIQITPSTILSHILIDLSKGMKEQNSIVEHICAARFAKHWHGVSGSFVVSVHDRTRKCNLSINYTRHEASSSSKNGR